MASGARRGDGETDSAQSRLSIGTRLDPDTAALERARLRTDIEWVEVRAADMVWDREFALAVMASNVFQVFVTDDELHASLAAVRASLLDDGQFVFGTRNPQIRPWERGNPSNPFDVVDHAGRELRIVYHVEAVMDDVVTFTETTTTLSSSPARAREAHRQMSLCDRIQP